MKNYFGTALLLFFATANAYSMPVVESVARTQLIIPACPTCDGGQLVTETTFVFSVVSCSGYLDEHFELDIREAPEGLSGVANLVTIQFNQPVRDCAGPTRRRNYTLSTTELGPNTRYIVTNPHVLR